MRPDDYIELQRMGLIETQHFVFYIPMYDMILSPEYKAMLDNFGKLFVKINEQV